MSPRVLAGEEGVWGVGGCGSVADRSLTCCGRSKVAAARARGTTRAVSALTSRSRPHKLWAGPQNNMKLRGCPKRQVQASIPKREPDRRRPALHALDAVVDEPRRPAKDESVARRQRDPTPRRVARRRQREDALVAQRDRHDGAAARQRLRGADRGDAAGRDLDIPRWLSECSEGGNVCDYRAGETAGASPSSACRPIFAPFSS